uniref:Probable molybdopterin-synthase adenylyltransferase n=1 Tax=Rhodogorgon sp. TaxID=2485824 RepID=A0A3G3MHX9_9FLOR|nr:molybdopterin biosynthesis protein [Rhodogorgon sp.]
MINPSLSAYNLSEEEYERYSRHLILNPISISGQKRIKAAKVLCIGAGGLSSSALLYLAASGIGTIGIIDDDTVDKSNLQRQILYKENNIEEDKVTAAQNNLNELNTLCQIKTYKKRLNRTNAHNIIKNYDIIIDGTDNITSRYIISHFCHELHKIHIYGAAQNFEGQISVFNYQGGPSYHNLYPKTQHNIVTTCNQRGVLGMLPGIVGLLQATETIKIITGMDNILSGHLLKYNVINMSFQKVKIEPQTLNNRLKPEVDDKTHNTKGINYISMTQLNLMKHNNPNLIIVDVREYTEFKVKHLSNSINIPLKNIREPNIIRNLQYNSNQQSIIIYCNNEYNSSIASKILNKYQIKHYILVGGIESLSSK